MSYTDAPAAQPGTTRVPGLPAIEVHKADGSDAKLEFGLPVIQSPENQFGEANIAGKKITSVPAAWDPRHGDYKWNPEGQPKLQRDPPFLFDGPHGHYHSTQTVGQAE